MTDAILTITLNPALDLSTGTQKLEPGPKLRCTPPRFDPGGGGVNVSRVIAELGGESTAWTALGGAFGQMYREMLEAAGIPCTVLEAPGQTRLSLNITEQASEDQYRFVLPGPEYGPDDATRALDSIAAALKDAAFKNRALAVVSGSMPPGLHDDFMARLADVVRDAGSRLVLDSSGGPLKAALAEGVYLVKPNLKEAEDLAGRALPDTAARADFAADLIDKGAAKVVVLSLGGEGAVVVAEGVRLRLHSPEVDVCSAVGAGDSTVGALALALAQGRSVEDAARRGIAAGAAAVSTTATELCRREDAERLVDQVRVEEI